jgi:hypothetical protein
MPLVFRRLLCLLALSLSLSQTAPGQAQSPSSLPNSHPASEEAALRAVVDIYYSAYGKKDLAGGKDVTTVELGRALLTQGQRLYRQGNYTAARKIHELAIPVTRCREVRACRSSDGLAVALSSLCRALPPQFRIRPAPLDPSFIENAVVDAVAYLEAVIFRPCDA